MTEQYVFENERKDLAEVAREMFMRKNTNVAGGNISVRITPDKDFDYGDIHIKAGKDYLIMTPTMMSEAWYAKLQPTQILVVDLETGKLIDGVGRLTREINMHEEAYRANDKIRCVYHSHAEESMFWATAGLDIPIVSRKTKNDAKVLLTFITAFLIMTGLTEIQSANVIQINIISCIILLIFGSLL